MRKLRDGRTGIGIGEWGRWTWDEGRRTENRGGRWGCQKRKGE